MEEIKVDQDNPCCPSCKSNDVARISYGIVRKLSEEEEKLVKQGKLIFGGCIAGFGSHQCNKCGFRW